MDEIGSMSHVDLLDTYDAMGAAWTGGGSLRRQVRAEILRRMDSAGTGRRGEIAPDSDSERR